MCGRYAASRDTATLVEEFSVDQGPQRDLSADYNVAPTKNVYVVVDRVVAEESAPHEQQSHPESTPDDQVHHTLRELGVARWGLVPSWAKDPKIGNRMINARVETLTEKPSYRRAVSRRRCLLPADGYYEWYLPDDPAAPRTKQGKPMKQPYFIHPADGSVLAMAGLYEFWRDKDLPDEDPNAWWWTTTVITTQATDELGRLHDRMPMCVQPERWSAWLDPTQTNGAAAIDVLTPAAPGWLQADPVSTLVNSVRNNGPELLDPLPAQ